MGDKRCPVCGMSVEGYQDKCECGFIFKGKTDGEIKEIEKQTRFSKKVALIFAVPALLASVFAKAAFQNGYGLYYLLFCAAGLVAACVILILVTIHPLFCSSLS